MEPNNRQSRVLKWSIIIGIVIVLNLFFNYSLSLFYKAPDRESYCPNPQVNIAPATRDQCVAKGGQWTENVTPQPVNSPAKITTPEITGYCNQDYTCQTKFDAARKVYERNVFVILVILGILSILVAIFWRAAGIVSIGLSLGGVLSLVIASIRYWGDAQNLLRVLILAVALAALIWVGVKRFKNE
ncbi:MAG TPA: hypothetical protein VFA52_01345 [Candidatus Paceibacterota bacterium]|nr:hypothetical protein [Candidatus Paceibacterota bacterium]